MAYSGKMRACLTAVDFPTYHVQWIPMNMV